MPRQNPLTTRQFRHDNRGVSEVLGAILVFALLILLLVLIQVNAVPAANEQVEFEHNQRVVQDFQSLQDGLFRASATGQEVAIPVETGVSYPPRFFLLNPGPATGTIRTIGQQPLTIENATASGEIGDFWTGIDSRTYATTGVSYQPNYNELQRAGTLRLEHSMLYRNFDNGNRYFDDPTSFIDGNRIRLTLLTGNFTRSSLSTSIEAAPVSHQRRTITIRNDSDTRLIRIRFQTDLDQETLDEQITDVEPNVQSITKSGDTATMTLSPGTYELTMSKIRVGSTNVNQPNPAYITDTEPFGQPLPEKTTRRVAVEVRDRFNNPVAGEDVDVQAEVTNSGSTDTSKAGVATVVDPSQTDSDGRVVVRYTTPDVTGTEDRDVTVTAWFGGASDPSGATEAQKVTFEVTVENTDRSGLPPLTGEAGVGQGGSTAYSPSTSSQLFTLPNGVWNSIASGQGESISSISLSEGVQTPSGSCSGSSSSCDLDDRVRLQFNLLSADGTKSYTTLVDITSPTDGTVAIWNNTITANDKRIFYRELTDSAIQEILDADADGTDILLRSNYENGGGNKEGDQSHLDELKLSNARWITSQMEGRVVVTVTTQTTP